jgi:hypothetical protein
MNAMTCHDVEEQLDLLAADECDRPTRSAVERHLEQCAACAARYAESRRLVGLLDLNWDAAGPERVRRRIEREERPVWRRPVVLSFARQAASLAALLLVTFGLALLVPRSPTEEGGPALRLSARVVRDDGPGFKLEMVKTVRAPADMARVPGTADLVTLTLPRGQSGEEFRTQLLHARSDGKLPSPPAVPIALELNNDSSRFLQVRLGDAATRLTLDVRGKGVVRVPAVGVAEPAFLRPRALRLEPGQHEVLHVDRLIAGSRGRLEYIYLTEPGEYTMTAHLRVTAGGTVATVTSPEIRIKAGN